MTLIRKIAFTIAASGLMVVAAAPIASASTSLFGGMLSPRSVGSGSR